MSKSQTDGSAFSDNVKRSSKNLWQTTSTDVKSNLKQKKPKELEALSRKSWKKYIQNLKYKVKRACAFYLILAGIPSNLTLSVQNIEEEGGFT